MEVHGNLGGQRGLGASANEREWLVRFTEVHLPRKQRITLDRNLGMAASASGGALGTVDGARLALWQRRDGFWVAVERREIWGYLGAVLEFDHSQVRITEVAVLPERRRRRVATELLAHVTEWSLRQRVDQLVFECPTKAQPAINFAMFHGFAICGFQDAYWPGQEVGLFFRKRIR
jgi:ribosomal protein S18 acetylase RimI-like enzyme